MPKKGTRKGKISWDKLKCQNLKMTLFVCCFSMGIICCDLDAHAQKSIALTAHKTTVLPSKLEQYT